MLALLALTRWLTLAEPGALAADSSLPGLPLRSLVPAEVAGGWGVREGEQTLRLGPLLGDAPRAFAVVEDAAQAAAKGTLSRRLGLAVASLGAGMLVGDAVLAGSLAERPGGHGALLIPLGVGGVAVSAAGILLMAGAHGCLAEAVRAYNEEALRRAAMGAGGQRPRPAHD